MKDKKITLIDVLIVLVLIAAVFVIKGVMTPESVKTNGKTEFVVLAAEVENELAENVAPGDDAVISHANKTAVEIVSVEKKPAEIMLVNEETKAYQKTESKQTSDLYITVSADADIDDNKIQIDDVYIRVGESVYLDTEKLPVHGTVIEIK